MSQQIHKPCTPLAPLGGERAHDSGGKVAAAGAVWGMVQEGEERLEVGDVIVACGRGWGPCSVQDLSGDWICNVLQQSEL